MRSSLGSFRTQLILAFALALFGFGLATQLRSHGQLSERLASQPERDLVEMVAQLDTEMRLMRSEFLGQEVKLASYKNSATGDQVIIRKTKSDIEELEMLTGAKPAEGPGIIIRIKDKQRRLIGFDFTQIINEIHSSGGWAITVNGHRLGGGSSFWRQSGYVYMDKRRLKPPFVIEAVGSPSLLYQAITLPRGVRDILNSIAGVTVGVRRAKNLQLAPLEAPIRWRWAKPAPGS